MKTPCWFVRITSHLVAPENESELFIALEFIRYSALASEKTSLDIPSYDLWGIVTVEQWNESFSKKLPIWIFRSIILIFKSKIRASCLTVLCLLVLCLL